MGEEGGRHVVQLMDELDMNEKGSRLMESNNGGF